MLKLTLLLAATLLPLPAGSDVDEVKIRGEMMPRNIAPTYLNGYLAVYELGEMVSTYKPDGSPAMTIARPENGYMPNVAIDTDGFVAGAVDYTGESRGGVSIFGPTGVATRVIDTGKYRPSGVCFAPDHTVWAIGWQEKKEPEGDATYSLLRRYSRDGTLLGEFLPRNSLPAGRNEPAHPITGGWNLRIAQGRVGAFLTYGGTKGLWVETDLQGKEVGRWPVDIDGHPAAFTATGEVYARAVSGIAVLDHVAGKWNYTAIEATDVLVGSDGDALVFAVRGENRLRKAAAR